MISTLLLSLLAAPPGPIQEPEAIQESAAEAPLSEADQALAALQAEVAASELGHPQKAEAFGPRFQEIADRWPGTDAGLTAELQLLNDLWWVKEVSERNSRAIEKLDRLLEVYADNPGLQGVALVAYNFDRAQLATQLDRVAEASPHREVDAAMHWAKLRVTKDKARTELLERARDTYGDLMWRDATYAELADAHLNPHPKAALAVGQPAPEIVGIDLDGKPMKLSDYRGQVVVLDFWGDW